jgi:LEA14-like dessication related protein
MSRVVPRKLAALLALLLAGAPAPAGQSEPPAGQSPPPFEGVKVYNPKPGQIHTPKLTIVNVGIGQYDPGKGITLLLDTVLFNPNAFNANVAELRYTPTLNGVNVGSGVYAQKFKLPKEGQIALTLPVEVRAADFQNVDQITKLMSEIFVEKKLRMEIDCWLMVTWALFKRQLYIHFADQDIVIQSFDPRRLTTLTSQPQDISAAVQASAQTGGEPAKQIEALAQAAQAKLQAAQQAPTAPPGAVTGGASEPPARSPQSPAAEKAPEKAPPAAKPPPPPEAPELKAKPTKPPAGATGAKPSSPPAASSPEEVKSLLPQEWGEKLSGPEANRISEKLSEFAPGAPGAVEFVEFQEGARVEPANGPDGSPGWRFVFSFTAEGLKGKRCRVLIQFSNEYWTPVAARRKGFDLLGKAMAQSEFVPDLDSGLYEDYSIFIPADALPHGKLNARLLVLNDKTMTLAAHRLELEN